MKSRALSGRSVMADTASRIKGHWPSAANLRHRERDKGKHKLPLGRLERPLSASDADVDPRWRRHLAWKFTPRPIQFLRLDSGSGRVQMGAEKNKLTFEKHVSDGWCVLVPAGTWHTTSPIWARSQLQVYAIYAPAPPQARQGAGNGSGSGCRTRPTNQRCGSVQPTQAPDQHG